MESGTIKWYSSEKGYGFIKPDSGGEDVFLHHSNISGLGMDEELDEGEAVEFETEQTPKGLSAVNASRAGDTASAL
jgi:CspA family cold shock protein